MISNWEKSGQGDGGYNFDGDDDNGCDDDYDSSSYRRGALDLCKNFVSVLTLIFSICGKCSRHMICLEHRFND